MNDLDYRNGDRAIFEALAAQRAKEDSEYPRPPFCGIWKALKDELKAMREEVGAVVQSFRQEVKRVVCAARFGLMAATYAYYRMEAV